MDTDTYRINKEKVIYLFLTSLPIERRHSAQRQAAIRPRRPKIHFIRLQQRPRLLQRIQLQPLTLNSV